MFPRIKKLMGSTYFWMEILMLVFITYFLLMFSRIEFYYYTGDRLVHITDFEYALTYSTYEFLLLGTYYYVVLKPNVTNRRPLFVFLSVIMLVPVIHLYHQYIVLNSMRVLPLLTEETRLNADRQYNMMSEKINFLYAYTLNMKLIPMIGFAYLIRALKQDEQMKVLKEQQLTAELNYLKAQLQPHFFFNTLNNIYGFALDRSPDTAPMIAKLAEMMRYILYHSEQQWVPLQQEIAFLKSYVDIERIRHHQHVSIELDVQGDRDDVLIAPLILLPFVENAFKHGVNKTIANAFVEIVLVTNAEELHFQVRNSKAMETPAEENEGGIGLFNVKKRLNLLYPDQHKLGIVEEKCIFQVNLALSWNA